MLSDTYHRHRSGLYLPGEKRPTCIDLFAGCGGFSLGMMMGGFEVVAGLEWEPYAALTYMTNLGTWPINIHYSAPEDEDRLNKALENLIKKSKSRNDGVYTMPLPGTGWIAGQPNVPGVSHFFFGDVRKYTGQQILDALGMKKGEVDCVVAFRATGQYGAGRDDSLGPCAILDTEANGVEVARCSICGNRCPWLRADHDRCMGCYAQWYCGNCRAKWCKDEVIS